MHHRSLAKFGAPLLSAFALYLPSFVWAETVDRCAQRAATLESLEGRAEVRFEGSEDWHKVTQGDHFCPGDTLWVVEFRAGLRLDNDSVVRLNEGSQVRFHPPRKAFWIELLEGAAHFITRTPKDFVIQTPYMNAAVDGTEFIVSHLEGADHLAVVEGLVRAYNDAGEAVLEAMQQVEVVHGRPPGQVQRISLPDAVAWGLYAPLLYYQIDDVSPEVDDLINSGAYGRALNVLLERASELPDNLSILNAITALALHLGQSDLAQRSNASALKLAPTSADAGALEAMMYLTRGDRDKALALNEALLKEHPNAPLALLVHSYVLQSQFDLERAFQSARGAAQQAPDQVLFLVRVAELALNLNNVPAAKESIERALKLAPHMAQALTLKGFVKLQEQNYRGALVYLDQAIAIDSNAALPRFASGMAHIRLGNFEQGRQRIELAVLLDPNNSLYRSYLGKAYFDERRFELATSQFLLAKTLDANDPTPYFYQALQYQYLNRPNLAFIYAEQSVERNNNRAVVRSQLQLDSDAAARTASLASTYLDLGLRERATVLAGSAMFDAPHSHTGHRMLAETLSDMQGVEAARASAVLQAQLTQPLSNNPIRPILSERSLTTPYGLGPATVGLTEFDSLFNKDQTNVHIAAVAAAQNTRLLDLHLSGLTGGLSYGLSHYNYVSDGFRENTQADYQLSSAFLQYQLHPDTHLFVEGRRRNEERGVLHPQNVAGVYTTTGLLRAEADTVRVGLSYTPHNSWMILGTAARFEDVLHENLNEHLADDLTLHIERENQDKGQDFQFLSLYTGQSYKLLTGLAYGEIDRIGSAEHSNSGIPLFMEDLDARFDEKEGYSYLLYSGLKGAQLLAGIKYLEYGDDSSIDTKFGARLRLTNTVALRLARFESTKKNLQFDQTLEPTNILGFIQYYDDANSTQSQNNALGLDYQRGHRFMAALELVQRDLVRVVDTGSTVRFDQDLWNAYAFWHLGSSTIRLGYTETSQENQDYTNVHHGTEPVYVRHQEVPVEGNMYFPNGAILGVALRYINQDLDFLVDDDGLIESTGEEGVTVDLSVKYKLNLLRGAQAAVQLELRNLANHGLDLQYAGPSVASPRPLNYSPQRYGLLKLMVQF